jgi:hypothetical protein
VDPSNDLAYSPIDSEGNINGCRTPVVQHVHNRGHERVKQSNYCWDHFVENTTQNPPKDFHAEWCVIIPNPEAQTYGGMPHNGEFLHSEAMYKSATSELGRDYAEGHWLWFEAPGKARAV